MKLFPLRMLLLMMGLMQDQTAMLTGLMGMEVLTWMIPFLYPAIRLDMDIWVQQLMTIWGDLFNKCYRTTSWGCLPLITPMIPTFPHPKLIMLTPNALNLSLNLQIQKSPHPPQRKRG